MSDEVIESRGERPDMLGAVEHEIKVALTASGLCHSDDHVCTGDIPVAIYPFVGGHEGAGVVEQVGPNTPCWEVGDHVVAEAEDRRSRHCLDNSVAPP